MARKAERLAYENKAEVIGNPEKVLIEVIKPHDGLERGYQSFKPYSMAKRMIELGYWKEVKVKEKKNESNKVSAGE
jgi:hypothetical protein